MKKTNSFNVYSFFALGLLIGAFSVYFYMDANQTASDDSIDVAAELGGTNFGVQSVDVAEVEEGLIFDYTTYTPDCASVSCIEDCEALGKPTSECEKICTDPKCLGFKNTLNSAPVAAAAPAATNKIPTQQHNAAAPAANVGSAFNIGQKKSGEIAAAKEANTEETKKFVVDPADFPYILNDIKYAYSAECVQAASSIASVGCYDHCMTLRPGQEEYCKKACVSSTCLDLLEKKGLTKFEADHKR